MDRKKELRQQYKERKIVGGVYRICNLENNKYILDSTEDMRGTKNQFDFAMQTNSCVRMELQKDWTAYGSAAFAFELLEELEKKEELDMAGFIKELEILKELWLEKYDPALSY